ncbi:hypothetical protein HMPREF3187_00955 [Aerococcus christensenii]|uniref:Uncharacterized protein n=1 Tax=Aerococcus christensenii TaxID=87541 RepID=A0A133XZ28_9LACT|nr:hypothetical protein HMPREF3187_00955 [Aerococcus christensenii]
MKKIIKQVEKQDYIDTGIFPIVKKCRNITRALNPRGECLF